MSNTVIKVLFNDEEPSKYDYKYFRLIFENGNIEIFNYHINNPMPNENEMIGLTWNEVVDLVRNKINEEIELFKKQL